MQKHTGDETAYRRPNEGAAAPAGSLNSVIIKATMPMLVTGELFPELWEATRCQDEGSAGENPAIVKPSPIR